MHRHMNTFRFLGTQQRKELCSSPYKSVPQRQHFWLVTGTTHSQKKKKKKLHLRGCKNLRWIQLGKILKSTLGLEVFTVRRRFSVNGKEIHFSHVSNHHSIFSLERGVFFFSSSLFRLYFLGEVL